MTSPTGCDGCQDELDLFAVSNRDTGHAQFLGPLCLAMFGATMLLGTSVEVADAAFKGLGYQPTAATKKARKDAEDPDFLAGESIIDVVESGPRPPDDESVSDLGDQETEQQVDKAIADHDQDERDDRSPGEQLVDRVIEQVQADETEPAPPY